MKKTWKKIVCVVIALLMIAGVVSVLAACNKGKVILVWGPDDHASIYMKYLNQFAEEHKDELAGYSFEYAGSGDAGAYDAMAIDARSGAGVYTFANDQTANLRNLGALAVVNDGTALGDNLTWSMQNNSAAAVESTKLSDGKSYAYPLQADNGYYMYYNKSAFKNTSVWDPNKENVDGTKGDLKDGYTFRDLYEALRENKGSTTYDAEVKILDYIDKDGKRIYKDETEKKTVTVTWSNGVVTWPMGDSWYGSGVFFAVGGDYNVAYDAKGKQTHADAWFAYTLPEGVTGYRNGDYQIGKNAVQCFINSITETDGKLSTNYLYSDGNSAPLNDYITYYTDFNDEQHWGATPLAACVCGTWKAKELQLAWGEDYAATVLPTLENDAGQRFTMKNFAGYKNMGVNPQCGFVTSAPESEKMGRLKLLHKLAQYLCGTQISIERYQSTGAGPANLEALRDPKIAADAALLALNAQYNRVCVYPTGYDGYEYAFDATENSDGTISYTRKLVHKVGGDPVGNGKGFRTQDSVPANYWTPIQNFGNVLFNEVKAGKLVTLGEDKLQQTLAQLQSDIQAAAQ